MKRFLLGVFVALFAVSSAVAQKTHFDNKPYVEGEFLVQLLPNTGMKQILHRAPAEYAISDIDLISRPMNIYLFKFNDDVVSHEALQYWLYSQPEVEIADYNYYIDMRATTPNDPNFNQQWHHVNNGGGGGTADADIDSDEAWDITTGGTTATGHDIVVCVIESGNLDHNDLTGNRWTNNAEIPNNGIDDDNNGYVDDYDGWNPVAGNDNYGTGGHGTNCLGMIGAKGDNNLLVTGANWDVKLMVVGDYSISTQANAIAAYTYPYEMRQIWNQSGGTSGAFVVATSSSWGIDGANPANYPLWCNFYDAMGQEGILNVGATTNQNLDVDVAGDMPTACNSDYMIGVGRTGNTDNTAGGYGDQTIEFGAPGINVVTTANTNSTTTTTGTSFACPLTAGVIGLAYSIPCTDFMATVMANPQQGADLVRSALMSGVDVIPSFATRFITSGRLNAFNTINDLMAVACTGSLCLAPSAQSSSNITDNTADISFTPFNGGVSQNLYWREVGAATWTLVSNVTSPYNLTGLTPCTDYEFYMETDCGGGTISSPGGTQTFTTTGCGACIDLAYCGSNATDNVDEWIEEFDITSSAGQYLNTSGNDNGYGDFTGNGSIQLQVNGTYPFTLTPGWGGQLWDEYSIIYLDLNQDGTFDPSEIVFDQGTASQAAVTGNITIPGNATLGNTRMRIQLFYYSPPNFDIPGVCDTYQYGEVEDYCVDILTDVICGFTTSETTNDPLCNGGSDGSISVDAVSGGTPGYTYSWSTGGSGTSVSGLNAGNYSVTITDAAACDTTINFTLIDPPAISATVTETDPDCAGASTGSIDVTNVTGGDGNYSYSWSTGGTGTSITGQPAGNYTLTITDGNGCSQQFNYTLTDPAAMTASFTSNANGLTVDFTNTSVGAGSYDWDFGDGNSSTQTSPSHTYAMDGTYTVCLTMTGSCGTDNTCNDVTVDEGTSSIGELPENLYNVYPNPADAEVNIEVTDARVETIELVDVTGKVIARVEVKAETTTMNVTDYADGTYFLRLKDGQDVTIHTAEVVVSH